MRTALLALEVLVSLSLIAVVLLQSGRASGISGAIGGAASIFVGRKKGLDEVLARMTRYIGAAFLLLTFLISVFF